MLKFLLANKNTDVNDISTKKWTKQTLPIQTKKPKKKTALIYAVFNRDIETMKLLSSNPKISPNIKFHSEDIERSKTKSALEFAIDLEQHDTIQLLLQHGSENV